jgi:hypothetical protein
MLHPERLRQLPRSSRLFVASVVVATIVTAMVACTATDDASDPPPEAGLTLPPSTFAEDTPMVTLPEGFVMPDTRSARLLAFESRGRPRTPPVEVLGGKASLRGTVTGPDGPVPGATVRLERFVGDRSGTAQITADEAGRWSASRVHGGRYRIRAWSAPTLTATRAQLAFVAADGGSAEVDITVAKFEGVQLQANLDLAVVNVGERARARALLTREEVDAEGIVVGAPVAGTELRLVAGDGGFSIEGEAVARTDQGGLATWPVTCTREGSHRLSVVGENLEAVLDTPVCGPPAITTTTALRVPDFAVGDEFTVPNPGVLPPGTYRTFLAGCGFSYEAYEDGSWQPDRREARGQTVELRSPVRNLRPLTGTDGCRYRRDA